ncbi:selenocysteine-specific translation elongation factor [Bacillaceae bacterium W0354]
MSKKHFTIGMAGHIDHGKTELTKVLTGINTDRLKEERERKISIELGFAPFIKNEQLSVAIIDVPGHEKFIRQMIAGVAGIDLTILVIAADEGIMPQTIEHMEVLKYLEIENSIIALTKVDLVDDELLELVIDDVNSKIKGTIFEHSPIVQVSSITGTGINELKQLIIKQLEFIKPKSHFGFFRMPIDQSFHVHGIGTVVRGTILEGQISEKDTIKIMPHNKTVQVKSIEHFGNKTDRLFAGNRAAIAISNISVHEVRRGDVLTNQTHPIISNRIDIKLHISRYLTNKIKQRTPIKLHSGTAEVYGKIILFDRNEIDCEDETVYAQLQLDDPIYVLKNDHFILRRATPIEMIGGGKIITPNAQKHRFGVQTVEELKKNSVLSSEELLYEKIRASEGLHINQLTDESELVNDIIAEGQIIEYKKFVFTSDFIHMMEQKIKKLLSEFHQQHGLLKGMDKTDLISKLPLNQEKNKMVVDFLVENQVVKQERVYVSLNDFKPYLDDQLKKQIDKALVKMKNDEVMVKPISSYLNEFDRNLHYDIKTYLLDNNLIIKLTDELYLHHNVFNHVINNLKGQFNESFNLQEAKEVVNVSRKYLIPLLEKLDQLNLTKRDGPNRTWIK